MEVGQRRTLVVLDMPPTLQASRGTACNQDRKVLVIVEAGIPHSASIQVHRMVEQRPVAVWRGLHLLEELREQGDMERIDLGDLLDLFGIIAVMARRMVRIWHADLWIRAVAQLARELERDDARNVCLERENLQIEHELRVVGKRRGNADGPI